MYLKFLENPYKDEIPSHIMSNLLLIKFIYLDGRMEEVMMDKITTRIEQLCDGLNMDFIDPVI